MSLEQIKKEYPIGSFVTDGLSVWASNAKSEVIGYNINSARKVELKIKVKSGKHGGYDIKYVTPDSYRVVN